MLSGTVHSCKRFLVEYYLKMVLLCNLAHKNHHHKVLVCREVGLSIYRRKLKLVWSHLIMPGLKFYSKLVGLCLKVLHIGHYTLRNGAKVVVFQLLVFCCCMSNKRSVAEHKVRSCPKERLVYKKILLLYSKLCANFSNILVKHFADGSSRLVNRRNRFKQRSLLV